MQLPPICEMDDEKFSIYEHQDVSLWAQSAIHLERIFSESPSQICEDYLYGGLPPFSILRKFDLTSTFRFGSILSDILAGTVYSSRFCSSSPLGTDILILNAPCFRETTRRTNMSEINAIVDFLKANPTDDFAILTPYRKQVSALSSRFPTAAKEDRVLTVHASQGREWDTLFFSVVDTDNMWFTDSLNQKSKGKQVINTAISRAKKHLVIACDYDYWVSQPSQLLGRLVCAGTLVQ